jgi:5-methylcytosine-specific restriction endonuclease McrBC regulatory subunit McrC
MSVGGELYAYGTKYKNCKKLFLIYPKDDTIESSYYKFLDNLNSITFV